MLFSGIPFLFYFLPAVLILYFAVPKRFRNLVLLLSSLFFYAWGEPRYVFLMMGAITLFYLYGLATEKAAAPFWKKFWVAAAAVTGAAMLAIFKYADFFIHNFNVVTGLSVPLLRLALPIGISFYTFQCLSYVIDVYRGDARAQRSIINFGTYVALFPQLIAGPIVRYVDVARDLNDRKTTWEDFSHGLTRFLVGLGKKVLLANQFGLLTQQFREAAQPSTVFYWLYAVAFTLHIYFDFSGYSDMAIGLGRIFGFHFPENFNYPYLSKSITEFWRRWHISLGSWFRDYVYIPLGGNRVGKGRWVFNILVVWMFTGLWHGASWNFVLWGLLFAALLLAEKWLPALQKLPGAVRHGYVLIIVIFSFVLFNAADLRQAGADFAGMLGLSRLPFMTAETGYYLKSYGVLFLAGFVGATPLLRSAVRWGNEHPDVSRVLTVAEGIFCVVMLLLCTAYLVDGSFNPFLYFRF